MLSINKKTIPIQIHFFLMYAGICPMASFSSTIAKQLGFSTSTVGLILFFLAGFSVFSRVTLGIAADKFYLLKTIKVTCLIACAVAVLFISLLPKRHDGVVQTTFRCMNNETLVEGESFGDSFCSVIENGSGRTCQILCKNTSDFHRLCSDWVNNNTTKQQSNFNCMKISADLQFNKSALSKNVCASVKIQKVNDGKWDIPWPQCSTDLNTTCSVGCVETEKSVGSEIQTPLFWYFFLSYLTFSVGFYVAVTLSDTICFQLIEDEPHLYGKLRVPGSFGWGLSGFLSGMLIDYFSGRNSMEKNYLPMFIFVITIFCIDAIWSSTSLKANRSKSVVFNVKKVYNLFSRFDVQLFAFWAFAVGFFQQITWQFSFWYLEEISKNEEDLNRLKTLQGFITFSNTITGDVISFCSSGWLSRKLGHKNCMSITLFLSAIRFFAYSMLTKPLLAIPIASLDGIIYGLQYTIIASYCNSIAAPGTEATVQAVFNCVYDGIGTSLGGLCGGFFYSWFGGSSMFRVISFAALGCGAFHVFVRYLSTLKKKTIETVNS